MALVYVGKDMIYLDNAATTKMDSRLVDVIVEYSCNNFYNPSAAYKQAFEVTNTLNKSKKKNQNTDRILFIFFRFFFSLI